MRHKRAPEQRDPARVAVPSADDPAGVAIPVSGTTPHSAKATCSKQQERLLALGAGARGDVFAIVAHLRIEGALDIEELRLAIRDITAANNILRTTFGPSADSTAPVPTVGGGSGPLMEAYDLTTIPPKEQLRRIESIATELRACLSVGGSLSPWQVSSASLSPTDHRLIIALSALCADATTVERLMTQLARAYEVRCAGEGTLARSTSELLAALEQAPRTDQRWRQRSRDAHENSLRWWQARLAAAPRVARLPFDTPFPDSNVFAPASIRTTLDSRTGEELIDRCRSARVSIPVMLLAAWRVLLWRLTGRADVLLGLGCAERRMDDTQEALDPIDRFVPFDLSVHADATFAEVLELAARRFEECRQAQRDFAWEPMDAAPGTVGASGEGQSSDYFSLTFEYRAQTTVARAGNTVFSVEQRHACIDRFDLGLLCEHEDGDLVTTLRFDAERIRREEAEPLLENLHVLLASALEDPAQTVGSLEILTSAQCRRILSDFNDTHCPPPMGTRIIDRIQEQAARTPDAPAVLFRDAMLTYRQLDARGNQLARYLGRQGVGPNIFVAIHAEPSLEMLIAIVGVLKAGGAYVPLDPENPSERLRFVLEDTAAPVLLTLAGLDELPTRDGVCVLRLDADWSAVARESEAPLTPLACADDLAYSIYTSGSTGNPKGVRVTNANLLHSTCARTLYYGGTVGRYLLLSSFAFDSSVAGIFWTLIDGGALVLPEAGTQRDPRRIGQLMARHGVTHSLCLASHYGLILSQAQPDAFLALDTAIVSGEVFSTALVERHDERAPGARLFNEYGPTEGSVWSTVFDCHSPFPAHQVPIGKPIANTQIYVLDPERCPVPIGVPGEMYQGGAGVTLGYLNRPDLTQEAFVPDPFSDVPGARLYRTGDLVRYLSDGNIEFLGRLDQQVKLRGYRIELGEIEAVLGLSDDLREVAVVCREDEPGERYLAAYYVCRPGHTTTVPELRTRLSDKLPAYMVPSAFAELDTLPRTNIGKLDATRLPVPENNRSLLTAEYTAPRTHLEEAIVRVWQGVLDREPIGIEDDYFELGGHSLLAIRIVAQLRDVLAVDVPLRAIFDRPTVAGIACVIEEDPETKVKADRAAQLFLEFVDLPCDPDESDEVGEHAETVTHGRLRDA